MLASVGGDELREDRRELRQKILDHLTRDDGRALHAAGIGDPCPEDHVRAAMLLRVNVHANGKSGCRPEITVLANSSSRVSNLKLTGLGALDTLGKSTVKLICWLQQNDPAGANR